MQNPSRNFSFLDPSQSPKDTIQTIKFFEPPAPNKKAKIFAAGGWDGYFRIYRINYTTDSNMQSHMKECKKKFLNQPIISIATLGKQGVFISLQDGSLKFCNLEDNAKIQDISKLEHPALDLFIISHPGENNQYLLYTSLDKSVQLFRIGNLSENQFEILAQTDMPGSITSVDYKDGLFACSLSMQKPQNDNQNVGYWSTRLVLSDLDQLFTEKNFSHSRTLEHKHDQTILQIKVGYNNKQLFCGFIDGRVSKSNITPVNGQECRYQVQTDMIFRADMMLFGNDEKLPIDPEKGYGILFQINLIEICTYRGSNNDNTFFIVGGSKGVATIWNLSEKAHSSKFECQGSLCSGKISPCGSFFVYGVGNDWHQGASQSLENMAQLIDRNNGELNLLNCHVFTLEDFEP